MTIIKSQNPTQRYVIKGTGVSVRCLVIWIKKGYSPSELAKDYDLSIDDVAEALAFYIQHQSEIDLS